MRAVRRPVGARAAGDHEVDGYAVAAHPGTRLGEAALRTKPASAIAASILGSAANVLGSRTRSLSRVYSATATETPPVCR
jgi:hypothetical protein